MDLLLAALTLEAPVVVAEEEKSFFSFLLVAIHSVTLSAGKLRRICSSSSQRRILLKRSALSFSSFVAAPGCLCDVDMTFQTVCCVPGVGGKKKNLNE